MPLLTGPKTNLVYLCDMKWQNTTESWGAVSRYLHWGVAVLILVQLVLGLAAEAWRLSPTKLDLFVWHKSLGILILVLVLLRLLWRLVTVTPGLAGLPRWQQHLSRANVVALYLCMLALPISGLIIQAASNVPFRVFWVLPWPDALSLDESLGDLAEPLHGLLAVVLMVALALHIGAAVFHHCIRRDGVLRRMWSGRPVTGVGERL